MKQIPRILVLCVLLCAIGAPCAAARLTVDSADVQWLGSYAEVTIHLTAAEVAEPCALLVTALDASVSPIVASDADYRHISTQTVNGNGALTVQFRVARGGNLAYYISGAAMDTFLSGEVAVIDDGLIPISGTVSLLKAADLSKVSIVATDAQGVETATSARPGGDFTVRVNEGATTVLIGRPGYLYHSATVNVTEPLDLGTIALIAGDADQNGTVSIQDMQFILEHWGITATDARWADVAQYDLNDDGALGLEDLQPILQNLGEGAQR